MVVVAGGEERGRWGLIKYTDICKILSHLLSVLVSQPAICLTAGCMGGVKRSISHSERSVRPECPAATNVSPLIDES